MSLSVIGRQEFPRFIVFSRNNGRQSGSSCIIDAHGEQRLFNNTFTVPAGTTIFFYITHGSVQYYQNTTPAGKHGTTYNSTNNVEAIASGRAVARERFDPNTTCPDYNLSKFQHTDRAGHSNDDRADYGYDDVESVLANNPNARDFVTIRNRRGRLDVTLKDVVAGLVQNGYGYATIHCSFCRGGQLDLDPPGQHVLGA